MATSQCIVVGIADPELGLDPLERASELAEGATLHVVVRCARDPQHLRQVVALLREASVFLSRPASWMCELADGDLVRSTIRAVHRHQPSLVVVSDFADIGEGVVAIAAAAQAPVLVARPRVVCGHLAVATDLERDTLPVLASGRRYLAPRTVSVFHDLPPTAGTKASSARCRPLAQVDERMLDRSAIGRLRVLRDAARSHRDVDFVVGGWRDPADGIVAFANTCEADVLAIGYPDRPPFRRPGRRTTARVVERCHHSVLVVPLARRREYC